MVTLRPAVRADCPAINAIYNHYVLHDTCTFQEVESTLAERETWLAERGPTHPVFVAETEAGVVGWASLSRYHVRSAYRFTVENSIYVRHDQHGRGIGRLLLRRLLEAAREHGLRSIIAVITENRLASITLHERHGFVKVGHFHKVGFKFGRWLDVVYLQWQSETPGV